MPNVNVPRAAAGRDRSDKSVKKYLPHTYRSRSTSSRPRTPNAVTDDAYHCAVRGATPNPGFKPSPDEISWGQVFASAIRQPQLATALGMIYQTQITVGASDFPKGGWLYVDLADDSDYKAQQTVDGTFIKRYAAAFRCWNRQAAQRVRCDPVSGAGRGAAGAITTNSSSKPPTTTMASRRSSMPSNP